MNDRTFPPFERLSDCPWRSWARSVRAAPSIAAPSCCASRASPRNAVGSPALAARTGSRRRYSGGDGDLDPRRDRLVRRAGSGAPLRGVATPIHTAARGSDREASPAGSRPSCTVAQVSETRHDDTIRLPRVGRAQRGGPRASRARDPTRVRRPRARRSSVRRDRRFPPTARSSEGLNSVVTQRDPPGTLRRTSCARPGRHWIPRCLRGPRSSRAPNPARCAPERSIGRAFPDWYMPSARTSFAVSSPHRRAFRRWHCRAGRCSRAEEDHVEVIGPVALPEATAVHAGFWTAESA